MAFSVQEFRSQLIDDGARPNLFSCAMNFPNLSTNASQKFTFMCKTSSIPGSTVNMIPVSYFGRQLKFAGNRTFSEWTVTIINDEDFVVRNAFEEWLSGINSHAGNLRAPNMLSGAAGYQSDATVYQYGKTGDVLKKYNFIGVFPIDVSPIELDWGANDTIEEYTVTLSYQWWESDTTDGTTNTVPVEG